MSKFHYVYSTLTANTKYTIYAKGGGDMPVSAGAVLIKGGANLIDAHFVTPQGVMTRVTDDELKLLEQNVVFNRHRDRGFIRVEEAEEEIADVVSDMTGRDESSPLVPDDYNAEDQANKEPKVNKKNR